MSTKQEKKQYRGILVTCFLIMFASYGSLSSFAIYVPEFAEGVHTSVALVGLIAGIYGGACVIFGLFVDKVFEKMGLKAAALIGALGQVASYMCYALATNIWVLYIGGIIGALGMAIGTMTLCATLVEQWYPMDHEKKYAQVCSGTGIGAAFWIVFDGYTITQFGYHISYVIMCVLIVIMVVPLALVYVKSPAQAGMKPCMEISKKKQEETKESENTAEHREGETAKVIYKTPGFWLTMIGMIGVGYLNMTFESYAPAYWEENGISTMTSSVLLCAYYIIGAITTALAGIIAKKYRSRVYITVLCTAFTVGVALLSVWGIHISAILLIVSVVLMSCSYALYSNVPGTITAELFGTRDYIKICTVLTMGYSIGQFIGPLQFSGTLAATGSYIISYITLTVAGGIALLFCLVGFTMAIRHRKKLAIQEKE